MCDPGEDGFDVLGLADIRDARQDAEHAPVAVRLIGRLRALDEVPCRGQRSPKKRGLLRVDAAQPRPARHEHVRRAIGDRQERREVGALRAGSDVGERFDAAIAQGEDARLRPSDEVPLHEPQRHLAQAHALRRAVRPIDAVLAVHEPRVRGAQSVSHDRQRAVHRRIGRLAMDRAIREFR